MIFTRSNVPTSIQVAVIGEITSLDSSDYYNGNPFQIKNDGDDVVELDVQLWNMPDGQFVSTKFEVGWNPEIVKRIKQNSSAASYDLKYGF